MTYLSEILLLKKQQLTYQIRINSVEAFPNLARLSMSAVLDAIAEGRR